MPAGLNRVCELITFNYTDDTTGGAVPSGTVLYQNLNIRIEPLKPTQALLEQGLQTPTLYQALITPGNIEAKINDQIRFTAPSNDWFYNKKFRVVGLQRSSNHPQQDRNQLKVIVKRWEESHGNEYQ